MKFQRSSPCFCGSEKKFKKCCEKVIKKEPKTLIKAGEANLEIQGCDIQLHTFYDPRLSDEIVKDILEQIVPYYEEKYPNGTAGGRDFIEHPRLTIGCFVNSIHPQHSGAYTIWLGPKYAIKNMLNELQDLGLFSGESEEIQAPRQHPRSFEDLTTEEMIGMAHQLHLDGHLEADEKGVYHDEDGLILSTKRPKQEDLTDELIEELTKDGWPKDKLIEAKSAGAGYSRERKLLMYTRPA